jgi:uncharacterized protein (DUF952 family)
MQAKETYYAGKRDLVVILLDASDVYDDVTYVYDDVTYVYDDVTYNKTL